MLQVNLVRLWPGPSQTIGRLLHLSRKYVCLTSYQADIIVFQMCRIYYLRTLTAVHAMQRMIIVIRTAGIRLQSFNAEVVQNCGQVVKL